MHSIFVRDIGHKHVFGSWIAAKGHSRSLAVSRWIIRDFAIVFHSDYVHSLHCFLYSQNIARKSAIFIPFNDLVEDDAFGISPEPF